jgi:LPS sulfotransferase NodH
MPWGRVGSNVLLAALDESPFVVAENEPLTKICTESSDPATEQKAWYARNLAWGDSNALRFIKLSVRSIIDHDFFMARFAEESDATFVFLERENPVHVVLSAIKARHYAQAHRARYGYEMWAVKRGREIQLTTPINIEEFMDHLEGLEADRALFDRYREAIGGVSFRYSDIQSNLSTVVKKICDTLGIPPPTFDLQIVKAITRPYREEFSGYDMLLAHISRNRPDLIQYF